MVNALYTVALDPTRTNKVVAVKGIQDVVINGESLGLGGYLDIGIIDTIIFIGDDHASDRWEAAEIGVCLAESFGECFFNDRHECGHGHRDVLQFILEGHGLCEVLGIE